MTFEHTLDALHGDESLRRREFPVVEDKIYLAHAAVCPLPACVVRALGAYLAEVGRGGQFEYLHRTAEAQARSLAASIIDATPEEIAFVSSTSAGLSMVAAGLPWQPGDSVVIAEGDFPSNVYPWLNLQRRGVQVRSIPTRGDGLATLEDVAAHADGTTRLVALSSVHYATGARLDVDAIGAYLNARNILFCVDAIQSLGAMPVSTRNVDFLVADAHKWMLGPQGIGLMFVRRSRFDVLSPAMVGWKSVAGEKNFVEHRLELTDTARRYEPGSLNALGLVGLHAALDMLHSIGVPRIAAHLMQLRDGLAAALLSKGYELLGPVSSERRSGIVSIRHPDKDMGQVYRALDAAKFVVSLREDPRGRPCVRVAPHLYNTKQELEQLATRC